MATKDQLDRITFRMDVDIAKAGDVPSHQVGEPILTGLCLHGWGWIIGGGRNGEATLHGSLDVTELKGDPEAIENLVRCVREYLLGQRHTIFPVSG